MATVSRRSSVTEQRRAWSSAGNQISEVRGSVIRGQWFLVIVLAQVVDRFLVLVSPAERGGGRDWARRASDGVKR